MIPYYMGKDTEIYGKCVRKYMVNVSLGSDTYPTLAVKFWIGKSILVQH